MKNEQCCSDTTGAVRLEDTKMKKTVFAVLCLAASFAWAQDGDEDNTGDVEKVDLRVSVLEVIDVTAEKAPAVSADEPDADIDAILDEAEALEDEED